MGYIKAWEILPKDIIKQIQQYIDGEVIYIPKLEENRKSWGENTNTKSELANRNKMIYADYLSVSAKYSCGFPDPQVLPIIVESKDI